MSYWWIDAIFIAIIVVYALVGLSKGFFESILRLVSTGASVGLAVWLARPASALVNKILPLVTWYEKALANQPDPISIFGHELTHTQAAGFLSIVTTGLVIFILVKIIIWILAKLFDSATKNNSALSGLNRLLGLIFGVVKGAVITGSLLATLSLLSSIPAMEKVTNAITSTKVTGWVYKYVDDFVDKTLQNVDLNEIINKILPNGDSTDGTPSSGSVDAVITSGVTESGQLYTVEL